MKTNLQISLSRLASKDIQEQFCVNGTVQAYLLPEELLDSALNCANSAIQSGEFTSTEISLIQKFVSVVNETADHISLDDDKTSAANLILHNPEWNRVREAAKQCLEDLGLELNPVI